MQQPKKKSSNLSTIIIICCIAIGLYLSYQDEAEDSDKQSEVYYETDSTSYEEPSEYVGEYTESLAPAEIGGLWGYVDINGNIVITPQFDYAWNFLGGVAAVTIGRDFGFIDSRGNFIERTAIDLPELYLNGYTGPITADTDMDIISDITDNVIQQVIGVPVSLGLDYALSLEDFSEEEYQKLVQARAEAYELYIQVLDERNEAAQKALVEAQWADIRLNGY